jgi:hypothetical protein
MCTINFSIMWISYCELGFSSFQILSLDEEAAIPTCNLAETMHNKWFQASGNNMTDLYNATLDDYCRAALQSIAYHNFLKGVGGGTGPNRSVLRLCSATRSGDPSKIARAVGELSADAGFNSRVPHLEGERIFGSVKQKLDLPPRDESDSHRHDRVNFSVPKIGCRMTPGQSRRHKGLNESTGDALAAVASQWDSSQFKNLNATQCPGELSASVPFRLQSARAIIMASVVALRLQSIVEQFLVQPLLVSSGNLGLNPPSRSNSGSVHLTLQSM